MLVDRKLELGHGLIRELCTPDVRKAERMVGTMRKLSLGRVKKCRMEVFAKGVSADEFVGWFEGRSAANDEAAMIAAHPERYIIVNEGGRQEVWETGGGAPFTARFVIDFTDKADATAQRIEGYMHFIAGKAVDEDGRKVGGAMHQFRDDDGGMRGVLSIDCPLLTPGAVMSGHKVHLAIEFSNWIEAAAASIG